MQKIADHPDIERTETNGYPTEEPEAVYTCCYCDRSIMEGDSYYKIKEKDYCEDCINIEFRKFA